MPLYRGACRITVVSVAGDHPQRVTVQIRGGADIEIPGEAGQSREVDAKEWELVLEHHVQGRWRQNIRAIVGKWTTTGDAEQTQTIRSRDLDGPARRYGDSLVLRLQRGSQAFSPSAAVGPTAAVQPGKPLVPTGGGPARHLMARPETLGGAVPRDDGAAVPATSTGVGFGDEKATRRRTTSGSQADLF